MVALMAAASPATAATGNTTSIWGTMFSAPTTASQVSPTTITLPGTVAQVGTSNSTEYALLTNGQVWAWGIGTSGQLGDGSTANSFTTPVQVLFPAGVTIASLPIDAMGYNAADAIDTNGNVWGWGYTKPGELCSHGSLYACGFYQFGAMGTGKQAAAYTPTPVVGMQNADVVSLAASSVDSYALLANGQVWAWGSNAQDQLGNATTAATSDVPVQVKFSDTSPAVQLSAGGDTTANGSALVMLADGTYWSWGSGGSGQLDNPTGSVANQTTPIEFYPPIPYTIIDCGGATGYGVTATGAVYSWGNGTRDGIGNGLKVNEMKPVEVISGGETMISATAQNVEVA
jgi:alpha-tubulin suppressor-like RCC1 family protein